MRPQNTQDEIQRRIAYHEAGHAVANLMYNFSFDSIDIVASGYSLGHVNPDNSDVKRGMNRNEFVSEVYKQSIVACSGHAVDCLYLKISHKDLMNSLYFGSEKDFDKIRFIGRYIMRLKEHELPELIDNTVMRASYYMHKRWGQVEKIADELYRKKRLTYDEVKQLIA